MNETKGRSSAHMKTLDMVYIALFAVLIVVCTWIAIPAAVPFTMQTFAVFCAMAMLGGKRGTLAVLVYLLLGAVGLPVFSGFKSGFAVLFSTTGGYLVGFIFIGLIYHLVTKLLGVKTWTVALALIIGLVVLYAFGTAWYMVLYAKTTGEIGIMTALGWCVFPFILPDLVKLALALVLTGRLKKHIKA